MKRFAASILVGLGLMFGVVLGGASLAGAATTAKVTSAPLTFNSGGVGTRPGHGSGLTHMKATPPKSSSSGVDPMTSASTHTTPGAAVPVPAANTVATSPASSLAFTGADVGGTIVLGLLLIGAGLVLVRLTRGRQLLV